MTSVKNHGRGKQLSPHAAPWVPVTTARPFCRAYGSTGNGFSSLTGIFHKPTDIDKERNKISAGETAGFGSKPSPHRKHREINSGSASSTSETLSDTAVHDAVLLMWSVASSAEALEAVSRISAMLRTIPQNSRRERERKDEVKVLLRKNVMLRWQQVRSETQQDQPLSFEEFDAISWGISTSHTKVVLPVAAMSLLLGVSILVGGLVKTGVTTGSDIFLCAETLTFTQSTGRFTSNSIRDGLFVTFRMLEVAGDKISKIGARSASERFTTQLQQIESIVYKPCVIRDEETQRYRLQCETILSAIRSKLTVYKELQAGKKAQKRENLSTCDSDEEKYTFNDDYLSFDEALHFDS